MQRLTNLLKSSKLPLMGLGYLLGRLLLVVWASFKTSNAFLMLGGGADLSQGSTNVTQRISDLSIFAAWSMVILERKGIESPSSDVETLTVGGRATLLFSKSADTS